MAYLNFYDMNGDRVDMATWGKLDRVVAQEEVGDLWVSTVLLGIDHNWSGVGPPIIFETMVFGDDEERTERYATRAQAEAGHASIVAELRGEGNATRQ